MGCGGCWDSHRPLGGGAFQAEPGGFRQCDQSQCKEQPCRAEEQRKLRGSPNSSAETCAPGRSACVRGAGDMGVPAEPREGSDKVLKQSQAPGVGKTLIFWGAGKALRE